MDIWRWILDLQKDLTKGGRGDVTDLIDALPEAVSDEAYGRVDALVPQAVAAARALKNPWLEVYFRHWDLQSRVLHRGQGKEALADAVALLEFAHRDETRGCPQSVCVVQDLCSCFGAADGPAYADRRVAVARETLARIDGRWSCWGCLTGELLDALVDVGRHEEALVESTRLLAARTRSEGRAAVWEVERSLVAALTAGGRLDEALALLEEGAKAGRDSKDSVRERAIQRAYVLARLGRDEEACAALPAFSVVDGAAATCARWSAAAAELAGRGLPNDAALGAALLSTVYALEHLGSPRMALEVAARGARLALARGAIEGARVLLERMEACLPELAAPLDAPERIAALSAAIAAVSGGVELPETPEALIEEARSLPPEDALERLEPGLRRWPEASALVIAVATARAAVGQSDRALLLLEPRLVPGVDEDVCSLAGHTALRTGDPAVVARVAASIPPEHRVTAAWILARSAFDLCDWDRARSLLVEVAAAVPAGRNVRRMLVSVAQRLQDHPAALAWLDELVALGEEPGWVDWEAMVSATVIADWARVRRSAARLGMVLAGEGPIDVRGSICKIRIPSTVGHADHWARRNGPVTARILTIEPPERPQVWGSVVVFHPMPVVPDEQPPTYTWVAKLSEVATWCFALDGVHPDNWDAIETALDAWGGECRVVSDRTYQLSGVPAVCALVVVPLGVSPFEVHEELTRLCAHLTHPLVWPDLADRIDGELADTMRAQLARWEGTT